MIDFFRKIKLDHKRYCIENIYVRPTSKQYESLKAKNKIKSFYDLPRAWQGALKDYIQQVEETEGKIDYIQLIGSLPTGNGIIPGKTPEIFKDLRVKYGGKAAKKQSDIDLYVVLNSGRLGTLKTINSIVNIEALPHVFQQGFKIYENNEFK